MIVQRTLCHLVGQIATGELPNDKDEILDPPEPDRTVKGGRARAANLSPERRSEILQLLCSPCNRIKGDRPMEYLMAQLAEC